MDERDLRTSVEAAGAELWNPPHLGDRPLGRVRLEELVPLPVGLLAVGRVEGAVVASPIVEEGGGVRRARPGDGVVASLLDVVARGRIGSLRAVHAATSRLAIGRGERAMGVDQANESYVIGDAVVLKLFPRSAPGSSDAIELPAHLASVGFTESPAALGGIRWRREALIASLTAYVAGARDGWEWYVEAVQRACAGGPWSAADAPAGAIGGLVARLHRALATPSEIVTEPTASADAGVVASWHARAVRELDEAVEQTPGDAGERARRLAPRARAVLDRLLSIDRTPVQPIHGDLHVGQILQDDDGALWVNDFDGNPLAPPPDDARDATARDVAAMACAIDHVGRVVARREPAAREALADWIERARAAFLSAYRLELGDAASSYDVRLLHPFSIAQEAHEYRYAASYLPRWGYVPDAAMPAAIARAEADA